MIKVLKPSSIVILDKDIEAIIISVTVDSNNTPIYSIAWWDNRQRQTANIYEYEMTSFSEKDRMEIGFK